MKNTRKIITGSLGLMVSLGILSSQLVAQQQTSLIADKGGKLHITSSVLVGSTLLKPGMYRVQHITEGEEHLIIFRIIRMGYRNNMGNEQLGEEAARVKCRIEPVCKKWRHSKLVFVRDASGQRAVKEVQIKGENVLHRI